MQSLLAQFSFYLPEVEDNAFPASISKVTDVYERISGVGREDGSKAIYSGYYCFSFATRYAIYDLFCPHFADLSSEVIIITFAECAGCLRVSYLLAVIGDCTQL